MAKPGLTPTRSPQRRRSTSEKRWKVPTKVGSGRIPRSFSTRSRISPAALLVKVTATIADGSIPTSFTNQATRWVMTRVLPEPAPASTSCAPSPWVTAARCSSLRLVSGLFWASAVTGASLAEGADGRKVPGVNPAQPLS